MSTPALDRDRLIRDLQCAALECLIRPRPGSASVRLELATLARAYRVVAAAILDGEYDADGEDR